MCACSSTPWPAPEPPRRSPNPCPTSGSAPTRRCPAATSRGSGSSCPVESTRERRPPIVRHRGQRLRASPSRLCHAGYERTTTNANTETWVMSLYYVQKFLYELNRDEKAQQAYLADRVGVLDGYDLTDEEIRALVEPDIGL